jgi:hypothetical protein
MNPHYFLQLAVVSKMIAVLTRIARQALAWSVTVAPVFPTERIAHTAVGHERAALQNFSPVYVRSFDHLVGAREQRRRDFDAERLRGLEINDHLELRRPLHRQVSGLRTL